MSMANNHGLDYGPDGLQETLAVARAQPDHFIDRHRRRRGRGLRPVHGRWCKGQRIAVIGATQVLDGELIAAWTATADNGGLASAKRVDRLVARGPSRPAAVSDTVIVFLHWGIETDDLPERRPADPRARRSSTPGADIVVGGHAHRLQGGGRLGDAVVHYGLGNFLFKENSAEGARTGVFEVTITGRRVDRYRWIPGRISGSVPARWLARTPPPRVAYWEGLRACAGLVP